MTRNSDQPIRSQSERLKEKALQEKYRSVGNPQLRAALLMQQQQASPSAKPQQQG